MGKKRADRRKYHYIYKITRNDGSGKYYIGMHSTDDLDDGYFGSGKRLWYSIKKHGKQSHLKEILEYLPTREALCQREAEIVCEELLQNPLCLNLKIGGEGGWDHISSNHFSHSKAGKVSGKKLREKIQSSPAFKKEYSECMSARLRIQYAASRNVGGCFTGSRLKEMTHRASSAEAIEKRKATFAERGHAQGEKNSQFGSCWVTDQVKPIKIKKEQLDEYLTKGFRRGRKYSSQNSF